MRGRIGPPLFDEREVTRHGEAIERLVPCPAGAGDDMGDQAIEVDFP